MKLLFTKPLATNPNSGLKTRYNSLTHKYTCIKKKKHVLIKIKIETEDVSALQWE